MPWLLAASLWPEPLGSLESILEGNQALGNEHSFITPRSFRVSSAPTAHCTFGNRNGISNGNGRIGRDWLFLGSRALFSSECLSRPKPTPCHLRAEQARRMPGRRDPLYTSLVARRAWANAQPPDLGVHPNGHGLIKGYLLRARLRQAAPASGIQRPYQPSS
jgi:hypothetical protein